MLEHVGSSPPPPRSMPHLHIQQPDEDADTDTYRPILIDWDNATDQQHAMFKTEAERILSDATGRGTMQNPIKLINVVYDKIGRVAEVIYPQKVYKHRYRPKPGWNKYVRLANEHYSLIESMWCLAGRRPHGPIAILLQHPKLKRKHTLEE